MKMADNPKFVECNGQPSCECNECAYDRWGDEQIERYGEPDDFY